MKAFLLAAGLGTRLRPLTDHLPKCLVPVGGRPMLDIWLDALAEAGVDEVLVNLHHLAPLVRAHLADRRGGPVVHLVEEEELLGSAGTLAANREFVEHEESFLALNADNLTDFDLRTLIDAQAAGGALATLSVFHAAEPSRCGIVTVDGEGVVTAFLEKPEDPPGNLANAGMYAFTPAVLDLIGPAPRDIGYHLLPQLVGKARTVSIGDSYFLDIGTPAALARAREQWERRAG
ncbi:nucleotidyltransferase family protein [Amycolatopsis sp. MEPSY49]|uniref:nucleotidyltransferase family protein n=1 Tax=Amycolatopsis sp. MEPSY49 TaxID=3151600 RepID=UPI003EF3FBB8